MSHMTILEIVDVEATTKLWAREGVRIGSILRSCEFCAKTVDGYQAHLANHLMAAISDAFAQEHQESKEDDYTCTCREGDVTCPFCTAMRECDPEKDLPSDQELDRAREELAECDEPPEYEHDPMEGN